MLKNKLIKNRSGIWLLEILIGVSIMALVSATVAYVFHNSLISYKFSSNENKASQNAQIAMEWISRDISEATCIYEANIDSIVLRNPTRGFVEYNTIANPTTMVLNDCTNDYTLVEDLTSYNFAYYDRLNQPTTFASDAKEVEITLTATSGNRAFTLYGVVSPTSCIYGCLLARAYGGDLQDRLFSSVRTSDGDFILGGFTDSFGPLGSGRNFLVIRADGTGGVGAPESWAITYSGDQATDVDELYCLDIYETGTPIALNSIIFGGLTQSFGESNGDFLVIKTDPTGDVGVAGTWAYTYGGASTDTLNSLLALTGDPILGGTTASFGPTDDFLVIKATADGGVSWAYTYSGDVVDRLNSIYDFDRGGLDTGYVLGGYTTSFGAAGDFLVVEIDSTGSVVNWANAYGGPSSDELLALQETVDSNGDPDGYILGGNTNSFGVVAGDILVIKIDSTGSVGGPGTWAKSYGDAGIDELRFLQQTSDGGYILGGYTTSFGVVAGDILLIKTDNAGVVAWAQTYGGAGLDELQFLQETFDADGNSNGYILGCYTESFGTAGDFLSIKTDALGDITCCIGGFTTTNQTIAGTSQTITRSAPSINSPPSCVAGDLCVASQTITPTPATIGCLAGELCETDAFAEGDWNISPICPPP